MESQQAQRKNEHLSLASKFYRQAHTHHYFDQVRLIHTGLPEMSLNDVDPHVHLGGLCLEWPFYIEAMTGGSQQALTINQQLATIAKKHHLAMATGSLSIALRDPSSQDSFRVVRTINPTGTVIANLSAKATLDQAQQAVDLVGADAIELHLNAAQELIMPEGDRQFEWKDNIASLIAGLDVPVIVKEVGFGMSKETVQSLTDCGAQLINVSGRGGTNFAMIEDRRNHQENLTDLFNWGQTTPESLLEARAADSQAQIIASGGICTPLDVIKAGMLSASAVGVAGYFLEVLNHHGLDGLDQTISQWQTEICKLMTLVGCRHFVDLPRVPFVLTGDLYSYAQQRDLI